MQPSRLHSLQGAIERTFTHQPGSSFHTAHPLSSPSGAPSSTHTTRHRQRDVHASFVTHATPTMSRKASRDDEHAASSAHRSHAHHPTQHTQRRDADRAPHNAPRSSSSWDSGVKRNNSTPQQRQYSQHDARPEKKARRRTRGRDEGRDDDAHSRTATHHHPHHPAARRPRTEGNGSAATPSPSSSSAPLPTPLSASTQLPPSSSAVCVLPLDTKLVELLYALSPNAHDRASKLRVIEAVRRSLQRFGLSTEIYGSLCTGVVIPASDVDCVMLRSSDPHIAAKLSLKMSSALLSLSAAATGSATQREIRTALSNGIREVGARLRSDAAFTSVLFIAHAKVPIVKCRHRAEDVKVDLSFEKDGCVSSNYLCELFCEPGNELARPLIVLVKALVNHCGLDDPSVGGLGSFPISLLVLWYLKQCVPSRYSPELQHSVAVLLVGFLKYYSSEFDHRRQGIDYVQQRIFAKAPAEELFVTNPLRPGTNCARAATLFSSRVVPCFQSAFEALNPLLSTTAAAAEMEGRLLQHFAKALRGPTEWREVAAAASRGAHLPQNMWDQSTNLYMGGVL